MPRTIAGDLPSATMEIGAVFSIAGEPLAPGDIIVFSPKDKAADQAKVISVGGDLMVLDVADAQLECRRWKNGDPPISNMHGHKPWFIYGLVGHTRP